MSSVCCFPWRLASKNSIAGSTFSKKLSIKSRGCEENMKRPALSIAIALGATLVMTVTAAASSNYAEWINGTELPNATATEGQFVGEATGSYSGTWYIDVRHQDLSHHPAYITSGSFLINTLVNGWPSAIKGAVSP